MELEMIKLVAPTYLIRIGIGKICKNSTMYIFGISFNVPIYIYLKSFSRTGVRACTKNLTIYTSFNQSQDSRTAEITML